MSCGSLKPAGLATVPESLSLSPMGSQQLERAAHLACAQVVNATWPHPAHTLVNLGVAGPGLDAFSDIGEQNLGHLTGHLTGTLILKCQDEAPLLRCLALCRPVGMQA